MSRINKYKYFFHSLNQEIASVILASSEWNI